MSEGDFLFARGSLSESLRAEGAQLDDAALNIAAEHALAWTVDELTAELVERFSVEPLEIRWDEKELSHKDAEVVVGHGAYGEVRRPGTKLTYHVPFAGDATLFKLQPSHFNFNPPQAEVRDGELRISVTAMTPLPEGIAGQLDATVASIKQYVDWVNADVAIHNRGLEARARAAVEGRRAKVLADRELVASLGVPVRRREDAAPTYAVAPKRRSVARPAPRGSVPKRPEPFLQAEVYEEVLSIMRSMVEVMERSPRTFARIGEEALRDHFLVQLNGQFKGGATGETFNYTGKTDILIREGERVIFVAECKFWRGPKTIGDTIDQILGYLSWRDTKAAIALFNRGRELSKVLAQIPALVAAHPSFVREIRYGGETDFRFVLRRPDDPERELTLSVLVFEVPA